MDSFLSQPITIVLAILSVLLYNIWKIRKPSNKFQKGMKLPQLSFALPLIGHLHLLGNQIPLAKTFASFADKYGPIFQIRLGAYPTLVISNKEAIKECFTTNDKILASRTKSTHGILLGYNHASFACAPYGRFWAKIRKVTMLELLSSRRVESLRHVYESEIDTLVKDLSLYVKVGKVEVVISEWMERLTFNIITKMICGKRYFEYLQDVDDVEANGNIVKLIKEVMHISGELVPKDVIPILGWFGFEGEVLKSMKRVSRDLDEVVGKWVEEHIEKSDDGVNNSNEKQDLIDVMLSVIEDDPDSGNDRDTIIKANIVNLMIAGSDTTSTTMTWILVLLLNNMNALKRAQEEIDQHIGRDRKIESSDIKNLVYLQAIVKETLRLHPTLPLSIPHEATEDCNIQGYYVPKGTRLFTNVWKLHRDPSIWLEPEKFSPERFINENGEIDHESHQFEYLPFGLGRRACPGSMFATQVIHIAVARLIHLFDFEVPINEVVDMKQGTGLILSKFTPLKVLLTPRLPYELYQ
uniref:Cytochrome P450 CYP82J17 n=1 Tax=Trigonella foenum-graecum TaxID=78534 RepID=82J17_TRIFG|nr:RecName: Full=Cytochrome P450 CYP82J17; Short=PpCYP82J17 [Trigonella foenum-graecum]QDS03635.1 cytochrome P450 CYP82J17 [Trigonella foenum-graecum]